MDTTRCLCLGARASPRLLLRGVQTMLAFLGAGSGVEHSRDQLTSQSSVTSASHLPKIIPQQAGITGVSRAVPSTSVPMDMGIYSQGYMDRWIYIAREMWIYGYI